jgi:purine catabolism regulator
MADITIHDVLAWEPRLQLMRRPLPGVTPAEDVGEREVSWVVTVRAAQPMLSPLRGGELVMLPDRVLAESGVALPVLLRELGTHDVSAAIVETPPSVASPIPVLFAPECSVEFETELNRMLTERRGDLYRAGTELGRILSRANHPVDMPGLVRTASTFLGCPVAVMNSRGAVVERSRPDAVPDGGARAILTMLSTREWRDQRFLVRLAGGDVLWFGPVPPDQRALVRLAADRIALAVESVLQRTVDERPRGAARATALNAVLAGSADAAERAIPMLGMRSDGAYRVALVNRPLDGAVLQRATHVLGQIEEAGEVEGQPVYVVQPRSEAEAGRRPRPPGPVGRRPAIVAAGDWLALSGEVAGAGRLPEAFRQAEFVAMLIRGGILPAQATQFDQLSDVGVYRLLYEVWGTPALATYVDDALGELRARDKRGTLRETLLAYLNAGGSQTETANALGIHRNTLAYRLRQIAGLTGRDPGDPGMRLVMHLALVAATLPEPTGVLRR